MGLKSDGGRGAVGKKSLSSPMGISTWPRTACHDAARGEAVEALTGQGQPRDAIAVEIDTLQALVKELEDALALEQEAGCDLARWGAWSHEWNQRRQAFHTRLLDCRDNSLPRRRAHQACAHLFPAWQRIHYAPTRGKPADALGLDDVKRRLREAADAYAAGLPREAGG